MWEIYDRSVKVLVTRLRERSIERTHKWLWGFKYDLLSDDADIYKLERTAFLSTLQKHFFLKSGILVS